MSFPLLGLNLAPKLKKKTSNNRLSFEIIVKITKKFDDLRQNTLI